MMISKILAATATVSLGLAGAASTANAQTALWNDTAPQRGYHGEVVSPNSLPPGFSDGTEEGNHAQAVRRWFSSQSLPPNQPRTQPNG
jgi:hypothetical protein